MNDSRMIPQPRPVEISEKSKKPFIGLPASLSSTEHRFPLTPEAVAVLVENGYHVKIEENAGASILYNDIQYVKAGAEIVSRKEAFECDIVIYLPAASYIEIGMMKRGSMLMSMLHFNGNETAATLQALLNRSIIYIAIELIADNNGNTPFADILAEVDGRASITLGTSMLIGPEFGKGILLGGVTGIIPCEVMILGSGIGACAAASSAIGIGAVVRMFDNDIYRLRQARQTLGPALITSALHPKVLLNALHSADIIISATTASPFIIGAEEVEMMKKGVIIMDITGSKKLTFPSLPHIAIPSATPGKPKHQGRVCFTSIGNAAPRTAAMALSNTFISILDEMRHCDGIINCVKLRSGVQKAVITFFGKLVNHRVANDAKMRAIDIHILLNCS